VPAVGAASTENSVLVELQSYTILFFLHTYVLDIDLQIIKNEPLSMKYTIQCNTGKK
jgi:hypothetical protein